MECKKTVLVLFVCITLNPLSVFSEPSEGGYRYPPELVTIAGAAHEKLLPEDEKIGKLNDASSLKGEAVRVLERAERFFDSLGEDSLDKNLLEPQSRRALVRFLESSFDDSISIEEVRYSHVETRFRTEERSASVEVRLFSDHGDTRGELLFLWGEEEWYIAAVNIDFNTLMKNSKDGENIVEKGGDDG
ncbi:MAG: hypothetical protein R6V67_09100 [Spirochaetia bacterium]